MQRDTGIIRKVDKLGRVVIPMEIRNQFEIVEGTPVEMFIENNNIILRKYEPNCMFCGNTMDLIQFKNKLICKDCIEKIDKGN